MGAACACSPKDEKLDAPGTVDPVQVLEPVAPAEKPKSKKRGEEEKVWKVAPHKRLTVMMFGMTGVGKSSLGNLIAGRNVFAAGDDTASMTNSDSIMRYEADDSSIILLDTIGLGDTEIDQDKVVSNIKDVALSAVDGIDVLLYVMRNVRITDDAIMRLIYVTEFLWGHECLLNLYIVVTCANRYLQSRADADAWIKRQVEINWRFKHIYGIVGNNPNRFIFIDNPDPESGEPGLEDRRKASYNSLMKMFAIHPREVIPPFTHAMIRKAQEMTEAERQDLAAKEAEVQRIQKELDDKAPQSKGKAKKAKSEDANAGLNAKEEGQNTPPPSDMGQTMTTESSTIDAETAAMEEQLNKAELERLDAEKAVAAKLDAIKADEEFQEEAARQAEQAAIDFNEQLPDMDKLEGLAEEDRDVAKARSQAGRRMLNMLSFGMFRKSKDNLGSSPSKDSKKNGPATVTPPAATVPPRPAVAPRAVPARAEENLDQALDQIVSRIKQNMKKSALQTFQELGGWQGGGAISPMEFHNYLKSIVGDIKPHHVGGLWRRGDSNCDGQIDCQEFRALLE